MPTMRLLLYLACLTILALPQAGCDSGSDTDDGNGGQLTPGRLTAYLNGERYETTAVGAALTTENGRTTLALSSGSPTHGLAFTLTPFESTGHYPFEGINASGNLRFGVVTGSGNSYTTLSEGGSGSVDVTRLTDERIEGTFRFTAVSPNGGTMQVTDGRFNVLISDS